MRDCARPVALQSLLLRGKSESATSFMSVCVCVCVCAFGLFSWDPTSPLTAGVSIAGLLYVLHYTV